MRATFAVLPKVTISSALLSSVGALVLIAISALDNPVNAAPPTVSPSPGYDARLSEQRARAAEPQAPVVIRKTLRRQPSARHHRAVR
jgi:hypothetical protein